MSDQPGFITRAAESQRAAGFHRVLTIVGIPLITVGMSAGGWFFADTYSGFQKSALSLATQQAETAKLLAVTAERLERVGSDIKDSNERIRRIEDHLFLGKKK